MTLGSTSRSVALRSVGSEGATSPATVFFSVVGRGAPVTVLAPGLGGAVEDTRPLAAGVPGTRVFMLPRSHGPSTPATAEVTYADLTADLLAVADEVGATQALGVSLGAATLARLVSERPDRFAALAFYLPAALAAPRVPTELAAALVRGVDAGELLDVLARELPAGTRTPDLLRWLETRASRLVQPGVADLARVVGREAPVEDPSSLAEVSARCVVVGCEDDPSHPADVARELAGAVPSARLRVFAESAPLWTARTEVRALLTEALGA